VTQGEEDVAREVAAAREVLARDPRVSLVEGSSFCVCGHDAAIRPGGVDGLFVRDTRVLSHWELFVDGHPVEPLTVISQQPFQCRFIGRCPPRSGRADATLLVERHRYVGQGMREDVVLRNYAAEPAGVELVLAVDADFADVFDVKEQRHRGRHRVGHRAVGGELVFWLESSADQRGVRVSADQAHAVDRALVFRAVVPAGGSWRTTVEVRASVSGEELAAPFPLDRPVEATGPARRMRGWNAAAPEIEVGHPVLERALVISQRDLGALRITDAAHPGDDAVAAGAPWFMALFGRDSLLTGLMMLPFFPELARGTLRTLARLQGRTVDPMSEEQPGRILHEVRLGADLSLALGGDSVYYGSVDATPLFVVLVGEALRWGAPLDDLAALLPAVDRALAWIDEYGDRDGDGFVEYQRSTDRGLLHQGWKDSFDAIAHADGRPAQPPIALAEVQGYCHAAFRARAALAAAFGDPTGADRWERRADELKQRFHDAFWRPGLGAYAVALDATKTPVDVLSSNAGQCLWTGIVDKAVAPELVDRLVSEEMFTGFGIRTLATSAASYNPVSYHNGSVWPHDSVLVATGMARYGFRAEAERVVDGLLAAADAFGGRLPELFCGFARTEVPVPVPYPTSCSPQAWAAAVPFQVVRIALGLDVDVPAGRFAAVPVMPSIGRVRIIGLRVGDAGVTVTADAGDVSVHGLPAAVRSVDPSTE
jgi:glycogen debranching enzyme